MPKQSLIELANHIFESVYPDEYARPQVHDLNHGIEDGNTNGAACYNVKDNIVYLRDRPIDTHSTQVEPKLIDYEHDPQDVYSAAERYYQLCHYADFYQIEPYKVNITHANIYAIFHEGGHAIGMADLSNSEEERNAYSTATRGSLNYNNNSEYRTRFMDYANNIDEEVAHLNGKYLLEQLLSESPELLGSLTHGYTPEMLAQSTRTPVMVEMDHYEMWHIEKLVTELNVPATELADSRRIREDILLESEPTQILEQLLKQRTLVMESACQLFTGDEKSAFIQLREYGLNGVDKHLQETAAQVGIFMNNIAEQSFKAPDRQLNELAMGQILDNLLGNDYDPKVQPLNNFHDRHPELLNGDGWPPISRNPERPWLADADAPDKWYRFYRSAIDSQLCLEERTQLDGYAENHLLRRISPMNDEKTPDHLYQLSEQQPLAEVLETAQKWWEEGPNYDPQLTFLSEEPTLQAITPSIPDEPGDPFQDLEW